MCPDENGELLPACLPFGPSGDAARALNEPGSACVFVFWENSHYEAMRFYYSFLGYGTYTTDQEWDFRPYPEEWLDEQRAYINAL